MLCSPFATTEGGTDIVTNVRKRRKEGSKRTGKTGGIGVRHFERFWGFKLRRELNIEYWYIQHPIATPFISVWVRDCLVYILTWTWPTHCPDPLLSSHIIVNTMRKLQISVFCHMFLSLLTYLCPRKQREIHTIPQPETVTGFPVRIYPRSTSSTTIPTWKTSESESKN